MFEKIYYDNFADEYVDETDSYAPPERYTPVFKTNPNIYIEVWDVDDGSGEKKRLDLAYLPDEYYDPLRHFYTMKHMCEKNHCTLIKLSRFYLPADKFDEYVKRFNLKE